MYPVAAIVGRGLAPDGTLDLDPLGDVVTDAVAAPRRVVHGVAGALSTVLTLLVALPGAYVLARYEFRGRRRRARARDRAVRAADRGRRLGVPAPARPGGPLAVLGLDQTVWAILLAHVFFNYAVVVRTVGGLWSHLDPHQEEAARMLGASRWRAFRAVTLPALRPAIAAAAAIVFLFTLHVVRRDPHPRRPAHATLETEIYRQTAQLLDLPLAAALAHRAARRGRRAARRDRAAPGPRAASRCGCAPRRETARRPRTGAARASARRATSR